MSPMKNALLVLALLASAACRKPASTRATGLEKPYALKGVVVSVDRAGGRVDRTA